MGEELGQELGQALELIGTLIGSEDVGADFLERDFSIDIDEIGIEFVGPVLRLTGNIEINLETP